MAGRHPLDTVNPNAGPIGAMVEPYGTAFVGSYGPPDEPAIHVLGIERGTGAMAVLGELSGIRNPSFLAVHPRGTHLYAVSEVGLAADGSHGEVHALRIDRRDGGVDLVTVNRRSTEGDQPCHITVHGSGRWLVVTNYGSGDVVVFPIAEDGSIGVMAARVSHVGRGADPDRQASAHPHSTMMTPDHRFVIAADLGLDRLVVYAFDEGDGSLQERGAYSTAPGAGPRHMAFHPDGVHLFVVNELDSTVTVLRWDADPPALEAVETLPTLLGDSGGNLAADIVVGRSGRCILASNRGHDSVTSYDFDPAGGLVLVGTEPCGGAWPRGLEVAPGGDRILVANERSDTVDLLAMPTDGCGAGAVVSSVAIPKPSCVVVVDD